MSTYQLSYKPFGEHAILVEWPPLISEEILRDVSLFKSKIKKSISKRILEVCGAYNSILITYKETDKDLLDDKISELKKIYREESMAVETAFKSWKIPVCYDDKFGLDLDLISKEKNLSKTEIVALHSEAIYTVYFIGFLPGFLYLGGLNEKLHISRKATPRLRIPKGAVAIGGNQTGIYPDESPGGWNIIGNSPVNFFDINIKPPCFAQSGDQIQFKPIGLKEYQNIQALANAGIYELESEVKIG